METKTRKQEEILVKRIVKAKEFYDPQLHQALRNCLNQGFEPLFMPQYVDTRIEADRGSKIWRGWYTTPSIRATGRTKQGTPVIIYAHIPNHFSNPDNIEKAIEQGLIKGAGKLPREEFQRLLGLEDNQTVFVEDLDKLRSYDSSAINVRNILESHPQAYPQIVPFLGGVERAEKYLKRHEEVNEDSIRNGYLNDLDEEPLARLLSIGNNNFNRGLTGDLNLDEDGSFIGVDFSGETIQKIPRSTKEQILKIVNQYTPPINQKELEERIKALF